MFAFIKKTIYKFSKCHAKTSGIRERNALLGAMALSGQLSKVTLVEK